MLPPGHVAGGYLAGKLASIAFPVLSEPQYLAFAAFFGFIPDLDFFLAFAKSKKMLYDKEVNHHKFPTHAPILYLVIFILWYFIFPETRLIAWTFLIGTWSHLLIDTFASDGTQWLYPFSRKLYRYNSDRELNVTETSFIKHWLQFVKEYSTLPSFKKEIAIITIAILTLIFTNH